MLEDAFKNRPAEIKPELLPIRWVSVQIFEPNHDVYAMLVVVETENPIRDHAETPAQCCLASVPKRRMPNVVSESARLDQVPIQPKASSDGGRKLHYFRTVR